MSETWICSRAHTTTRQVNVARAAAHSTQRLQQQQWAQRRCKHTEARQQDSKQARTGPRTVTGTEMQQAWGTVSGLGTWTLTAKAIGVSSPCRHHASSHVCRGYGCGCGCGPDCPIALGDGHGHGHHHGPSDRGHESWNGSGCHDGDHGTASESDRASETATWAGTERRRGVCASD